MVSGPDPGVVGTGCRVAIGHPFSFHTRRPGRWQVLELVDSESTRRVFQDQAWLFSAGHVEVSPPTSDAWEMPPADRLSSARGGRCRLLCRQLSPAVGQEHSHVSYVVQET